MKREELLKDLFAELEGKAYNAEYHNYYYKEANQVIRAFFERTFPPAEGAEEIFNKYQADAPMKTRFINFNEAIKAMQEFATLHAQRLAEKMVEERMEQYKAQFKDRPNPRDVNPYDSKGIKRIRNRKIR